MCDLCLSFLLVRTVVCFYVTLAFLLSLFHSEFYLILVFFMCCLLLFCVPVVMLGEFLYQFLYVEVCLSTFEVGNRFINRYVYT